MRKIESAMNNAIRNRKSWASGNTSVVYDGFGIMKVYLHGNEIGMVDYNGVLTVNHRTLREYPTPTTKSRLRALGANVYTKAGVTFLDGVSV